MTRRSRPGTFESMRNTTIWLRGRQAVPGRQARLAEVKAVVQDLVRGRNKTQCGKDVAAEGTLDTARSGRNTQSVAPNIQRITYASILLME